MLFRSVPSKFNCPPRAFVAGRAARIAFTPYRVNVEYCAKLALPFGYKVIELIGAELDQRPA